MAILMKVKEQRKKQDPRKKIITIVKISYNFGLGIRNHR